VLFVVSQTDVYKSAANDLHIVFGEIKVEDLNNQAAAMNAAQQLPSDIPEAMNENDEEIPQLVDEEEGDEEVDEEGLEQKDIELVIQQANVSRAKAVKALKENDSDIVNAIMALSS
jgi:nascent polypeptide-associated complex subunit alpha